MSSKICNNCRRKISKTARYCPYCGAFQGNQKPQLKSQLSSSQTVAPNQGRGWTFISWGFILFLIWGTYKIEKLCLEDPDLHDGIPVNYIQDPARIIIFALIAGSILFGARKVARFIIDTVAIFSGFGIIVLVLGAIFSGTGYYGYPYHYYGYYGGYDPFYNDPYFYNHDNDYYNDPNYYDDNWSDWNNPYY